MKSIFKLIKKLYFIAKFHSFVFEQFKYEKNLIFIKIKDSLNENNNNNNNNNNKKKSHIK